MSREIITINVGQGGVQLAQQIWYQYNSEHKITKQKVYNFSSKSQKYFFLDEIIGYIVVSKKGNV